MTTKQEKSNRLRKFLMYNVLLSRNALKDLESLDAILQKRITTKLKEFSADPLKYARKLMSPKIGTY